MEMCVLSGGCGCLSEVLWWYALPTVDDEAVQMPRACAGLEVQRRCSVIQSPTLTAAGKVQSWAEAALIAAPVSTLACALASPSAFR